MTWTVARGRFLNTNGVPIPETRTSAFRYLGILFHLLNRVVYPTGSNLVEICSPPATDITYKHPCGFTRWSILGVDNRIKYVLNPFLDIRSHFGVRHVSGSVPFIRFTRAALFNKLS